MIKQIRPELPTPGRYIHRGGRSAAALLSLLLALPLAALAADAGQEASWQERLDKAAAMQDESQSRQEAASRRQAQKNLECEQKFLVNDCRAAAYREYLQTTHAARRLENEGKAIEREVKREQLAAKRQRQAAEAPRREAEQGERAAETAAARLAGEQKAEAMRADKARRAADGERRKAAEAERLARKRAAHEARLAERKLKAEQGAAPDEAK